jgi:hypothetical protein
VISKLVEVQGVLSEVSQKKIKIMSPFGHAILQTKDTFLNKIVKNVLFSL